MAILPITLYGDTILKKKAIRVSKVDAKILTLINDMFDSMHNADGMGLAANQVGSHKSIFVLDLTAVKGFEKTKPMVFINPKIVEYSEETTFMEEGCLSLPGIRSKVERPVGIKLLYQDLDLNDHVLEDDDLLARVIQHEYDHLQATFFTDRLDDEGKKMVKKPLQKIVSRKVEIEYPVTEKGTM
ncbi:MAG: peptide deformylase [Ignavibacteria bacterium]|nr:peptide deformylase [Ignavibacteria bacterium]